MKRLPGFLTVLAILILILWGAAGQADVAYGTGAKPHAVHHGRAGRPPEAMPSETDRNPTPALGRAGRPVAPDSGSSGLLGSRGDGGSWSVEPVDSGPDVGTYASLALDAAGQPRIAYIGGGARYAAYDGTSWSTETVDPSGVAGTSLQLDAAGRPHISYVGATGLSYAFYDGAAWAIALVDPAATDDYTSLDLDSLGRPHIAYLAVSDLRYAYFDGGDWFTETVHTMGAGYPSLALDSADLPHIGYTVTSCAHYCYPMLVHAWNDGVSWNEDGVDNVGGWYERMVLDTTDHPHFAYRDGGGYPPFGYPMYAREEDGGWANIVVDGSSWVSKGYTSLALDGAGRPHIAYCGGLGWEGSSLRYASPDGTAWVTETVDTLAPAYPSLALDAQGYAHIAYYDSTHGGLRYARQACNPIETVSITGPVSQPLGITALYTATYTPVTATAPAFAWDNGAVGAVAPYLWTVTGTHALAVTGTNACSTRTAGLTVTVFCQPLAGAAVRGPYSLLAGQEGTFWAVAEPITSSPPVTFTWDNGTVGPQAIYSWTLTGTYTLTVSATNLCGGIGTGKHAVHVLAEWPHAIYLPLLPRLSGR